MGKTIPKVTPSGSDAFRNNVQDLHSTCLENNIFQGFKRSAPEKIWIHKKQICDGLHPEL